MQSIIIVSPDIDQAFQKAKSYADDRGIEKFDVETLEFEKAMGIPDVRLLKERIFLKPLGKEKALIIRLQNGATVEAQNALLKILEEPPPSCSIITAADNTEAFLPTVLSRCRVIKLTPEKTDSESPIDLSALENGGVDKKFITAQNLSKDKNEAVQWLEQAIIVTKKKAEDGLKKGNDAEAYRSAEKLKLLSEAHQTAKNTNANLRLTLENLFLSI